MPNTASASVRPWTCAMPQSSRVIVTRAASALQRAGSGSEAAVRISRRGASAAVLVLRIRQGLLGFLPACKRLRLRPLQQFVDVADAEMMAAVIVVELVPGDRRGHRCAFAAAGGVG